MTTAQRLKADNARLMAENADLRKQLAGAKTTPPGPATKSTATK